MLSSDDAGSVRSDAWLSRAVQAIARSTPEGVFTLAASRPKTPPPPGFVYFHDFGSRYLSERCQAPPRADAELEPIEPPAILDGLLLAAPPMPGAEYLNADMLAALWRELDDWLREQVRAAGSDFGVWLKQHAPSWHQVGRVCLHLAENRNDPDYPFAFLATYAPGLASSGAVKYQPLGRALEEYAGKDQRKALVGLLSPLNRAAQSSTLVKALVDSGDVFHPLAWTPSEAYAFLRETPTLEQCGVLVRVPDWWRRRTRAQVSVTIDSAAVTTFSADAMLEFDVGVAIGDDTLTEDELQALRASDDGLVFLKGQWVEVDRARLDHLLDHWQRVQADAGATGMSFIEGMRLLAGAPADLDAKSTLAREDAQWFAVRAGDALAELLARLRSPDPPDTSRRGKSLLKATLRPYQEAGRDWLHLLCRLRLGACLADDMGLGKTVQVIALLLSLDKPSGDEPTTSLLVLPASLLANWQSELSRFAPSLKARFVHPSEVSKAELKTMGDDPAALLANTDLVVTTYSMLTRQEWLLDQRWRVAILDEAQAIKNPGARQTKAVKRINAQARIALSGTPIENRLSDLWSLFDFLCPGLLGSATRFRSFVKTLEDREEARYAPLRNLVRPYILRRLKTDKHIISDLPDKTEVKAYCSLTRGQAGAYQREVEGLRKRLESSDGMERRGLVLATLLRLKQICNHPAQRTGGGDYRAKDSGKFQRLAEIADEIGLRQERLLVFTQFREMTTPLADFLGEVFARAGLVLDGSTAVKKRKALVDDFQRDDGPPFMVLSLKAGGVGLNLTAASHVVHFDRWWNPAVENQATDRAFRIGQHRNVVVHKFICRGTVEEQIDALIADKTQLMEDLVEGGGETLLTEMSDSELLATVALDVDRALN